VFALALPSLCDLHISVFSLAFNSESARSLGVVVPLPLGFSSVSLFSRLHQSVWCRRSSWLCGQMPCSVWSLTLSLFLVSCSVWPPSLLEAAFFFCYSSTALAGGYSCVTLTPYPLFSRKPAKVCVCITIWSWRLKVHDLRHVRQSVWQLHLHIHFRQYHYGLSLQVYKVYRSR